jgi:hypothetical protein
MEEKDRAKAGERNHGAAVKYDDARGEDRYVGGGAQGGQNWSNEGYGANQSYSAGPQYATGQRPAEAAVAPAQGEYAVSPEDLGVADYDLQGGYGRPAENGARQDKKGEAPPRKV